MDLNTTLTTEERLVCALRAHRSADFSTLYDAYSATLYGAILRLVKDSVKAEDLLQDAFIKIWLNSQRYDPKQGRLFTWVLTIARNLALDELRAQKVRLENAMHVDDPSLEVTYARVGQGMLRESLLSPLAPKHRDIVELMYYQGYTCPEVANRLNLPLGTVKSRSRLALQHLKAYLVQDIHQYHAGYGV